MCRSCFAILPRARRGARHDDRRNLIRSCLDRTPPDLTRHSILHDVSTTDMTHARTEPDTQRAQAHSHTQTTPINGRDTTPNKKPHRTSYPFVQKARYGDYGLRYDDQIGFYRIRDC